MTIQAIYEAVLSYDEAGVIEGIESALDSAVSVDKILADGLISAMDEIGARFSDGKLFIPEMLMAAHAMKAGLVRLKPLIGSSTKQSEGVVVIGTVKGDLHDIGKNLVTMMLEGGGFTVIDLGVDVSAERFVEAAKTNNGAVVALSALLTTTLPSMRETVAALLQAGLKKTIVGGAPVTQEFADNIGAAGYSQHAPGAVLLTRTLVKTA